MKTVKVSIVLPCHNVADYISRCLESIQNQTFKDIEIICIDDKSTDNTVKKIKSFMKSDKRICLYKLNKNYGVGYSRNYGLKKAQGKYICFIDSDDYIDNDFVSKLYKNITENKSDAAKANTKVGENIVSFNNLIKINKLYFSAQHWSAMYNKKFLLENNILYPEDVMTGQDVVFLSNLVLHAKKITVIDDTFYHYVRREGSLDSEILSHEKILSRIKMLDYKIEMLKEHKFDTDKNKNIFIKYHILDHFFYTFNSIKISDLDKKLLFKWLVDNSAFIGKADFKSYQLRAIKHNNMRKFIKRNKLFHKERFDDGFRKIYFCGIKIFSYKKKTKSIYNNTINYKTYNDLAVDIKTNISKIPDNIDLIVGIPRSGMIPAYILALALNKRVCSLQEFTAGLYGSHGITRKIDDKSEIKNILIIDDSIDSGESMKIVKQTLSCLKKQYNYYFSAVYCSNEKVAGMVDVAFVILPQPRVFEWNYLNHRIAEYSAYDIDGVLCVDPTNEQNDDGKKYKHFLLNAKPLYIPKRKIAAIVTSRFEKYRPETEAWLKKHNIQYDKLYMLENMTAEERCKKGVHASYKAKIYNSLKNVNFFIESDPKQAREIAEKTSKKVFCASTDELFN